MVNRKPDGVPIVMAPTDPVEGSPVTLSVDPTDLDGDEVTATWKLPDGTTATGNRVTWIPPDSGTYTELKVTLADDFAATDVDGDDVVVANALPTFDIHSVQGDQSSDTRLPIAIKDPSAPGRETFSVTVDWGDGSPPATTSRGLTDPRQFDLVKPGGYAAEGRHTARVTITDSDGAAATGAVWVTVNDSAAVASLTRTVDNIKEGRPRN